MREGVNAVADTVGYGQLWVKTATPNELYFTTDEGDDIQLTTGTGTAGGGGGSTTETIHFFKRFYNLSSSSWKGGYEYTYSAGSTVWGLGTTKVGSNFTDTTAGAWAAHNYSQWLAPADCTVTSFTMTGYQNSVDTDILVGLWKITMVDNNSHTANMALDFIGELVFEANADITSVHAPHTTTSFESGASISAGDLIGVFAMYGPSNSGTDSSYWFMNGAIQVEFT